jgi:hypothetical protein
VCTGNFCKLDTSPLAPRFSQEIKIEGKKERKKKEEEKLA